MNSARYSTLNREDQKLVVRLSKDEDVLQGIQQPTMDIQINNACLRNTDLAHSRVVDLVVLAPLFNFPGEDAQPGYRRQFIIARTPGNVQALAFRAYPINSASGL